MVKNNRVNKIEQEKDNNIKVSKEDIIESYMEDNKSEPSWKDKKTKNMTKEENNEYKKYRKRIENERIKQEPKKETEDYKEDEDKLTKEEHEEELSGEDAIEEKMKELKEEHEQEEEILTPEEKQQQEKLEEENILVEKYFQHHNISTQEQLNYAIEHDEKFKMFLEKTDRMDSLYTGKHLERIEEERKKVLEELEEVAKKDKGNKILKKFKKKKNKNKKDSNNLNDSKKNLDLAPYINNKLEKQGYILCFYLRKNGLAEMRYVRMDEVGQIKVDGYVYHERDATYRFGKKNTPVLVIMEGSLVPVNKETLKENLGCESAEAQKLIIKGIEQAEVVKSSGVDENAKKPFAPPKWAVVIGIAVVVGIYAFMGGFS